MVHEQAPQAPRGGLEVAPEEQLVGSLVTVLQGGPRVCFGRAASS